MGRKVAVAWHASFSIAAGVLYFFFVLPRLPELTGGTSHTLGTVLRIVTGALIGLAALPVVFTLLRTRKPELGTPAVGADPADVVDRAARAGGRADRRDRDQRDLAQPRQRRALAVRHLRCRRGDSAAWRFRLLPGVRRRDAATAAETPEAQGEEGARAVAGGARPRKTRSPTRRMPRNPPPPTRPPPTSDEPSEAEQPAESGEQPEKEPAEVTAEKPEDETRRAGYRKRAGDRRRRGRRGRID